MKISIITVCYNSAATLGQTIHSVAMQTYNNVEYIVIDGKSTDNTLNIIKNNEDKITKWISEPDKGLYDAMNKGIKLATGDVIGILNSDDIYDSNTALADVMELFKNENNLDSVHAELYYVQKDNIAKIVRHWKSKEYFKGAFKKGWHPAHPTFFVKREVYEKYGLFNLDFKLAADFELMLRFIERYKISSNYLPKPIIRMRLGGATSKNITNIIKQNFECFEAFKINEINVSTLYFIFRLLPKIKQFLS